MDQDQLHAQMASAVDLSQPETHGTSGTSRGVSSASEERSVSARPRARSWRPARRADGAAPRGSGAGDFSKTPGFKFTFINHVTTNTFFQATQYGLQDAAALLGLPKPQWTGSETSNVSQMVSAMNTAVTAKVDGIAIALVDEKAFNDPVRRPSTRASPWSRTTPTSPPTRASTTWPGPLRLRAGHGRKDRDTAPADSKIAIFIATPGSLNIQPRADGAIAALKAANKGYSVKQVATGADEGAEQTAIDAFYTGNKDYKGLFAVDAGSTQGVAT